jgi:uncharacterized protein (DUF3820 family)
MVKINFGRYRGLEVKNVPINYLEWLFSLPTFYRNRNDVKSEIIILLEKAGKIKLGFNSSEEFNKQEWIKSSIPPPNNSIVISSPNNRRLMYCMGKYYSLGAWVEKDDVTHYKLINQNK